MSKDFSLHPELASTFAMQIDLLYFLLVAISVIFMVAIVAVIIFFVMKYRRKSDDERPKPIHGSLPLELAWSIIPFFICMGVFTLGADMFFRMYRAPADALNVYVVGKQWMWKVQHPEGNREINELHVPLNPPIRLTMTSDEVLVFLQPGGVWTGVLVELDATGGIVELFATDFVKVQAAARVIMELNEDLVE